MNESSNKANAYFMWRTIALFLILFADEGSVAVYRRQGRAFNVGEGYLSVRA